MKTLFLTLLLLLPITSYSLEGSVSLFTGNKSGAIFDVGYENLRIEMIGSDNPILGLSLKTAFDFSNKSKLWFGVGMWEHQNSITDNTDTWFVNTLETESVEPAIFIEYEHSSGWFFRASHHEGETSAIFKGLDIVGTYPDIEFIPKNKTVTESFSEELYFIGYKLNF